MNHRLVILGSLLTMAVLCFITDTGELPPISPPPTQMATPAAISPAYTKGWATAVSAMEGGPGAEYTSAREVCTAWSSEGNGPEQTPFTRDWINGCADALDTLGQGRL